MEINKIYCGDCSICKYHIRQEYTNYCKHSEFENCIKRGIIKND